MSHWSDDQLRAYLRGTLGPADMDAIDAVLAVDEALAERMVGLAEGGDDDEEIVMVRDAFAPIDAMPVPPAMTAAVMGAAAAPTNVVDFSAAAAARRAPRWSWPQLGAMAASLAIGLVVGQGFLAGGSADGALVVASADGAQLAKPVAAMLDRAASGTPQQLAGLGEARVVISFRDSDGRLCRQFEVAGKASTTDAVSCRQGGDWTVEAVGSRAAAGEGMRTASGDAAPAVLATVDAIIAGDVLVGADEAAALKAR